MAGNASHRISTDPLFPPRPRTGRGSFALDAFVGWGLTLNLAAIIWLANPWAALAAGAIGLIASAIAIVDRHRRRTAWKRGEIIAAFVEPDATLRSGSTKTASLPSELAVVLADPVGLSLLVLIGMALTPWWLLNKQSAKVLRDGHLLEIRLFGRGRKPLSGQYCWVVLHENVAWTMASVAPADWTRTPIAEDQVNPLRYAIRAQWSSSTARDPASGL